MPATHIWPPLGRMKWSCLLYLEIQDDHMLHSAIGHAVYRLFVKYGQRRKHSCSVYTVINNGYNYIIVYIYIINDWYTCEAPWHPSLVNFSWTPMDHGPTCRLSECLLGQPAVPWPVIQNPLSISCEQSQTIEFENQCVCAAQNL